MSYVHSLVGSGGDSVSFPQFTYTGQYDYTIDGNSWKLKLLSSGTLRFSKLGNAKIVDAFLVGGGGGGSGYRSGSFFGSGGGGGYTKSVESVILMANSSYSIVVGAGGAAGQMNAVQTSGGAGGRTSAFGNLAEGGKGGSANGGSNLWGGNGGSGGSSWGAAGGVDGGNGSISGGGYGGGGTGQGTSTRAFYAIDHDSTAELYSNGGSGGTYSYIPRENFGDGGKGGNELAPDHSISNGTSGIVIIRPHVEVY